MQFGFYDPNSGTYPSGLTEGVSTQFKMEPGGVVDLVMDLYVSY